jgi:hypothetical protein
MKILPELQTHDQAVILSKPKRLILKCGYGPDIHWQAWSILQQPGQESVNKRIQEMPGGTLLLETDIYLASSARSCFAAFTMLVKAGTTSAYFLVFSPQSGLIHSTLDSSTASILRARSAISSVEGMRGE